MKYEPIEINKYVKGSYVEQVVNNVDWDDQAHLEIIEKTTNGMYFDDLEKEKKYYENFRKDLRKALKELLEKLGKTDPEEFYFKELDFIAGCYEDTIITGLHRELALFKAIVCYLGIKIDHFYSDLAYPEE